MPAVQFMGDKAPWQNIDGDRYEIFINCYMACGICLLDDLVLPVAAAATFKYFCAIWVIFGPAAFVPAVIRYFIAAQTMVPLFSKLKFIDSLDVDLICFAG